MECPNCNKPMVEKDFGGVFVDVCELGCNGIWFDWMELIKLNEREEGSGPALKDALHTKIATTSRDGKINCPHCHVPMFEHLYKANKSVRVDECYSCGGFFLDQGELFEIRNGCMNEQEYNKSLDQLVQHIHISAKTIDNPIKHEQRENALKSLARFFHFS